MNIYSWSTFCVHNFLSLHLAPGPWYYLIYGSLPLCHCRLLSQWMPLGHLSRSNTCLGVDIACYVPKGIWGNGFSFWCSLGLAVGIPVYMEERNRIKLTVSFLLNTTESSRSMESSKTTFDILVDRNNEDLIKLLLYTISLRSLSSSPSEMGCLQIQISVPSYWIAKSWFLLLGLWYEPSQAVLLRTLKFEKNLFGTGIRL